MHILNTHVGSSFLPAQLNSSHCRVYDNARAVWHSGCDYSASMNAYRQTRMHDSSARQNRSRGIRTELACGVVKSVDLISRDMTVQLPTGVAVFDIPPDCLILLHGEPTKLRLVQPFDRVCITFTVTADRMVAEKLEVQSGANNSCLSS